MTRVRFSQIPLIVMLSACLPAMAGEKVDESLAVANAKSVVIENISGKVVVAGNNAEQVVVTGELDDDAKGLTFEHSGSRILVKVKMPHDSHDKWRKSGTKLSITLPKHLRVSFKGVSSDIELKDLDTRTDVNTVSGDVVAKNLAQQVELVTVSGNIESQNLSGKVRLSSVSGDISDNNSSGRVFYRNVSGDIVGQSSASEVSVKSVSGNAEVLLDEVDEFIGSIVSGELAAKLTLNDNGLVKVSSVSGDLTLNFAEQVNASFKLKTSAGGNIVNKLSSVQAKRAKYGPSAKLVFEQGNGEGSVRASTVSGTIEVK